MADEIIAPNTTATRAIPLRCLECPAFNRVLLVQETTYVPRELATVLNDLSLQTRVVKPSAVPEPINEMEYEFVLWDTDRPVPAEREAIQRLRQRCPRLPLIVLSANAEAETAIELVKAGAHDFLAKPIDATQLKRAIQRAVKTRQRLCEASLIPGPATTRGAPSRFIGPSPAMQEVFKQIGLVARRDEPVLILGETGTGKELVAQTIHRHSRRCGHAFVAINCAAIPETLLESELFGHEKGAFTGATHLRLGAFERAHGGTLFLDEIGDMSLPLQAKMLRALQEGEIRRVGGHETIAVDVRLLTATNKLLEKAIEDGTFREDLYYRLNVVAIRLPPLRERREDILQLIEYFIERYTPPGEPRPALDAQALRKLQQHTWPGNVRELENTVRRALVTAKGNAIMEKDIVVRASTQTAGPNLDAAGCALCRAPASLELPPERVLEEKLNSALRDWFNYVAQTTAGENDMSVISRMEAKLVDVALAFTQGNQAQAARLLGISRTTLRQWMSRIGGIPS